MKRLSIVAVIALATATLHGGQAPQQRAPERGARSTAASTATPTESAARPVRPASVASSPAPAMSVAMQRQVMDQYCVTCHNSRLKTAGLTFDAVDLTNVAANAEVVGRQPHASRPRRGAHAPHPPERGVIAGSVDERVADETDARFSAHDHAAREVDHLRVLVVALRQCSEQAM